MNIFNGSEIIISGRVIENNLNLFGLSTKDIHELLKENNIESIDDVQYAVLQIDGNLYIETK